MGWGKWLLLGDLGQQLDLSAQQEEIEHLKKQLESRSSASATIKQRLKDLERENDEMKLYLATIFRLLVSKNLASAEEIKALVSAIDREDGTEDLRHEGQVLPSG
jgi:ATP-dependent exoDNAse (exonuclease V) beta subunit